MLAPSHHIIHIDIHIYKTRLSRLRSILDLRFGFCDGVTSPFPFFPFPSSTS